MNINETAKDKDQSAQEVRSGPEGKMEEAYSVKKLIGMARALSEGEFNRQFEQDLQGELGQMASYLESLRQNLTLLSPSIANSADLMPEVSKNMAGITQDAEVSVNSILEQVDEMCIDQGEVMDLIEKSAQGKPMDLARLKEISMKSKQSLSCVISYLSFQDVMRQRTEKIQEVLGEFQQKVLELLVKFRVKVNKQAIEKGSGQEVVCQDMKDLSEGMGLNQNLVDDLLDQLG